MLKCVCGQTFKVTGGTTTCAACGSRYVLEKKPTEVKVIR